MQRDQVACSDVRAAWPEVGKESSGLWLPGQCPFTFLLQLMPCKFILYQLGSYTSVHLYACGSGGDLALESCTNLANRFLSVCEVHGGCSL